MEASILCQIYRTSVPYFGARSFTYSGVENAWRFVVVLHHKFTEILTSTRDVRRRHTNQLAFCVHNSKKLC